MNIGTLNQYIYDDLQLNHDMKFRVISYVTELMER